MAADKLYRRIEAKLDALLEKNDIDPADFEQDTQTTRRERKLTPQEQQAIDNAPDAPATVPEAQRGPRVTAQNAPDTSSSVPKVPSDAVGTVTVETEQPSGKMTVDTMPASAAKGKK